MDAKEESKRKESIEHERPWDGLDISQIVSIDFGCFGFAASFCPVGDCGHQRIIENWSDTRVSTELNKNLAALLVYLCIH